VGGFLIGFNLLPSEVHSFKEIAAFFPPSGFFYRFIFISLRVMGGVAPNFLPTTTQAVANNRSLKLLF
jgi:hypothetical protein